MATRNINSFIEHLMNEAMTTSGGGGDGDNRTPGDPASYDNPDDAPSGSPKPFIPDQGLPSLNNPTGRPRQRRDFRIPPSLLNPDSFDDDTVDMSDIIRDLLRDPVADDFYSIPVPTPLGIMPFLLPKKKK